MRYEWELSEFLAYSPELRAHVLNHFYAECREEIELAMKTHRLRVSDVVKHFPPRLPE